MAEYYKTRTEKKSNIVSKPGIGKRTDCRFLVPNARIQLHKRMFLGFKKKIDYKVSVVNLSINGFQALSTEALCPNDEFDIILKVPKFSGTMPVRAKVIWCKLYKIKYNEPYYRIGFKFSKLTDEVKNQLKQLEPITG